MNLPTEKHSHGLRHLAAIESSRGSFDGAVEAIGRATGQHLGKRQVEDLAGLAAVDFDTFYLQRQAPTGAVADVLVISCDGKGIVMRPGALRPATAKAAAQRAPVTWSWPGWDLPHRNVQGNHLTVLGLRAGPLLQLGLREAQSLTYLAVRDAASVDHARTVFPGSWNHSQTCSSVSMRVLAP